MGDPAAAQQVKAQDLGARSLELLFTKALMAGIDFQGLTVLDVGAGTGSDSYLFHCAGGAVTALEPALGLLTPGSRKYPELSWLGGNADAIPLQDNCMDVVTANASLHHHFNVRTSFDEMTRVLKTGGWILTVGDSFKGSSSEPVEVDWQQFDTHPSVLHGINEQILRLDVILDHLQGYGGVYEGHVYIREGRDSTWRILTLDEARTEITTRPRIWGVMALRLKKVRDCAPAPTTMRRGPFSTLQLTAAMRESASAAFAAMAALLPAGDVRENLPLDEASRLLQLNGWRWPRPGAGSRFAYGRGRLFLRRLPEHRHLLIEFSVPPLQGVERALIACELDGTEARRSEVLCGVWYRWCLELPTNPISPGFCCFELQHLSAPPRTANFDPSRQMEVRSVELATAVAAETGKLAAHTTLAAMQHLAPPRQVVLHAGSRAEIVLTAISRLLASGMKSVQISIADRLWPYFSWHPALTRTTGKPAAGSLILHAGMTDIDAAPEPSPDAWQFHPDGVISRLSAPPWPDRQLTVPSESDDERKQLAAKLAKSEAKLAEAKARADKFKEKYEASRKRRDGWVARLLKR